MTEQQESRKHHYVPEFLLKPWLLDQAGQRVLCGFYWDSRKKLVSAKRRGLNSFCCQLDLLSLRQHQLGRDAIEKIFFGEVDTKGATARDLLIDKGVRALNGEQRTDFARVLLSLEARRPQVVEKIREMEKLFATKLNTDPEVISIAKAVGIKEEPSKFLERKTGVLLADRAFANIQRLVDNPKVGGRLINATWSIVQLKHYDETLLLADRPLLRLKGFDDDNAIWIIPLSPSALFVAANNAASIKRLSTFTTNRIAKDINLASAKQVERFIFSVSESHKDWLKYHLPRNPVASQ